MLTNCWRSRGLVWLRSVDLLQRCRFGRGRLSLAKFVAALAICCMSFILFYGLSIAIFAYCFGFEGWDTSVQLNLYWSLLGFPEKMNLLELSIGLTVVHFISLLFVGGIVTLASCVTKSSMTAFALSTGILFAPDLLLKIVQVEWLSKFLMLFSLPTGKLEELLMYFSSKSGFYQNSLIANSLLIVGVRIGVMLLAFLFAYARVKRMRI